MSATASVTDSAPVDSERRKTAPLERPRRRVALLLLAGIVVASAANAIVAAAALAAGSTPGFPPLMPAMLIAFTTLGVAGGYVGWRVVRRLVSNSRRLLTWLVPVALVLSWIPDLVLMFTGFIPGSS